MFSPSKLLPKSHRCYSAFAAETIFDKENVRKTMEKFAKMQLMNPQVRRPARRGAVLVPLCVVDHKVSLLYTLRAANLKSHRGQVSFPGGMEDAGDKDAEHTAVRETYEEIGLGVDKVDIWGRGKEIGSKDGVSVLPVIGVLHMKSVETDLKINPSEVREVFTVPLEVLCDPVNVGHTQFRGSYSMPVFTGGRRKIWGLTAIITHLFLKALLPKEVYKSSIKYVPPLKGSFPYRSL